MCVCAQIAVIAFSPIWVKLYAVRARTIFITLTQPRSSNNSIHKKPADVYIPRRAVCLMLAFNVNLHIAMSRSVLLLAFFFKYLRSCIRAYILETIVYFICFIAHVQTVGVNNW